jgi:hypothetical protein
MTMFMTETTERHSSLALQAILDDAPEIGLDAAVLRHGSVLPAHVQEHLAELDDDDVAVLMQVRDGLGGLDALAMDNNNNI